MLVDLINHGQKLVGPFALAPVDLVHAQGIDPRQLTMSQSPLHEPFHRTVNRLPTGLEGPGRFSPRQSPPPASQKSHHRRGHRPLSLAPGNMLDPHTVLRAFHPPRPVEVVGHDSPHRHKEPAPLFQLVIARTRLLTGGTFASNSPVWLDLHLHAQRTPGAPQADALVNKSRKMLYPVQERLNFQLSGWLFVFHTRFKPESVNDSQPLLLLNVAIKTERFPIGDSTPKFPSGNPRPPLAS